MIKFDYKLEPGKKLNILEFENTKPIIAVIMPFYNDGKYIEQSVNCVLNQTIPFFELIIVDDGSKDKDSLDKLKEISKLDKRIRVFHKENEGLSATRDYGAKKASSTVKYLVFFDSDDLIQETFLETLYWTLETNKEAAWAYPNSVGFESLEYTWTINFDSERMKKVNDLIALAMIRKDVFWEVNGYGLKEKSVNEDWNFWLKLIAKGYYPVHVSYFSMWYRRKASGGELKKSRENKNRSLEIVQETAKNIKNKVSAIQYPRFNYNYDIIPDFNPDVVQPIRKKDNKINILMMIPWMVTGGADIFNLELLKRIDKSKFNVTLITTEPSLNNLRQQFEEYVTIYDLTSFLDMKHWPSFINYIIKKEHINLIFNTNSTYGYFLLPYLKGMYPNIPIIDYIHMEEWYNKNGGYARNSYALESVIDKTLVCNKQTERVLYNHFGRSKGSVETVYIGVDTEKFNPDKYNKKEFLKKYKLEDNNKIVISYICRIAAQKRPLLFFEIMKKTLATRDDVIFVVAGDGEMLDLLKNKVKENNMKKNVIFLGNVSNTYEVYKISDITLNCSIKEGLALTSYESLSMGIPVISSDVGGQKELIDNKTGVIVPCLQREEEIHNHNYTLEEIDSYVDAIDKIIKDLDKYKKNCRKRILNQFTLDQMAENMSKIFINTAKTPNEEKIKNGKDISKQMVLTKELITISTMADEGKMKYLENIVLKEYYNITPNDTYNYYRRSRIRDALWKIPFWRKLTETKLWKLLKRGLKR